MKMIGVTFVLPALAILSGCVAVPVTPGYVAGPPGYYAPAPAYYAPPVYYRPSLGISIRGGGRGHGGGPRRH